MIKKWKEIHGEERLRHENTWREIEGREYREREGHRKCRYQQSRWPMNAEKLFSLQPK